MTAMAQSTRGSAATLVSTIALSSRARNVPGSMAGKTQTSKIQYESLQLSQILLSRYGEELTCTGLNEVVVGRCGSGRNKDCPDSSAHGIVCCLLEYA